MVGICVRIVLFGVFMVIGCCVLGCWVMLVIVWWGLMLVRVMYLVLLSIVRKYVMLSLFVIVVSLGRVLVCRLWVILVVSVVMCVFRFMVLVVLCEMRLWFFSVCSR